MSGRKYLTFNYPYAEPGGKTLLTGVRKVEKTKHDIYISGWYQSPKSGPVTAFVFKGNLSGKGVWYPLSYPSSSGATVVATNLYGPNNGIAGENVEVVGSYTTVESGTKTFGCLYEGPLNNSSIGKWTTLIPSFGNTTLNTIAHSTMGGLVVGNYDVQLNQGKAFLYDIEKRIYFNITQPNVKSITAYGIWHNDGSSYTICGGYSELQASTGVDSAYLVDWDNKHRKLSNFRSYSYNNDPVHTVITHFDGIHGDGKGGYNLTGNYVPLTSPKPAAFFARFKPGKKMKWSLIEYPESTGTSGNTVVGNAAIGVYQVSNEPPEQVNGYVSV